MLGLIKKIFIELLTGLINRSNHTKCVSLNTQKCMSQPTLINFHPNEYSQEFHCYPFSVKWDRYVGSCNTLNDLSNKVCVPNKTEDLNLSVFNMITGINELKISKRLFHANVNVNLIEQNVSLQWLNNDKCWCEWKKHHVCEKEYIWNPSTCIRENGKYLETIMDYSVITCDEFIASYEKKINFNEKEAICKIQNFYIFLVFLLITIVSLIAVSIYCYLIKYQIKYLLAFHNTNNKWNKFYNDSINWKWVI